MKIIAYAYEADVHCIDCTAIWAESESLRSGGNGAVRISEHNLIEYRVAYFNGLVSDIAGAPNPLFSTDEWQELDESFLEENPTQYLACGDCGTIIDSYTVDFGFADKGFGYLAAPTVTA